MADLRAAGAHIKSWPPSQPFTIMNKLPPVFQEPPANLVTTPSTTELNIITQMVPTGPVNLPPIETFFPRLPTASPRMTDILTTIHTSLASTFHTAEVPTTPQTSPTIPSTTLEPIPYVIAENISTIPALALTIATQTVIPSIISTSIVSTSKFEMVLPPGNGPPASPQTK